MASTTTEPHPYTPFIRAHLIGKGVADIMPYAKNRIEGNTRQAPPSETFFENEQPENILIFTVNIANTYNGHKFGQPTDAREMAAIADIVVTRNEGLTTREELDMYLANITTASAALLGENVYRIAHGQGTTAANVMHARRSLRVLNAVAESGNCQQWDMVYGSLKSFFLPTREDVRLIYRNRNEAGEEVVKEMRGLSRMCLESLARHL